MIELETAASFGAFGSTAVVAVSDPRALPAARARVEEVVTAFDRALWLPTCVASDVH